MKPAQLPDHWKAVRMGDICDVRYGLGQPPELDPVGVPMVRATDIKNGEIISESVLRVKADAFPKGRSPFLKAGDILVVRSGAYTGDVAMYDGRWEIAIAGYDLVVSPNGDGIDSAFLANCLLGDSVQRYFRSQRDRSAQPHLNSDQLKNTLVPLPPLLEQRAIVRALRAVQEAKEARRREAALERERKAALMQHLFTHGIRGEATKQTEIGEMPESWEVRSLGAVAEIAYGLTVNEARRNSANLAPYLAVANVTRGALRLEDVKQIGMLDGDAERYRLKQGDVLLVEGNGNPKLLGSAAIWNDELPFALHQNHLIRARPDQGKATPEWIMCYLNSDSGRAQLLGKAKTSSGLHSINSRLIAGLQVPLPSRDEQEEATHLLRSCNKVIAGLERETALLDELFRALLEALMTGRLSAVPLIEPEG
jgi:type I restriction enzyme S subunit